nr:MAG TPA: hypothetical protein [Caudoviricetes sp.]
MEGHSGDRRSRAKAMHREAGKCNGIERRSNV